VIFRRRHPNPGSPPRSADPGPVIPRSAAVPRFETWPDAGIGGRIGRGDYEGCWVIAECDQVPFLPPFEYHLMLPANELRKEDGSFLLVFGCEDELHPDGGGLIDLLTDELDVAWSPERADYLAALDALSEDLEHRIDEERKQQGLRPFDWTTPEGARRQGHWWQGWLSSRRP
jgi:hypothetical protein